MSIELAKLTSKQISLALLALQENWTSPPEELKHLTLVEWMLLEGMLNELMQQKQLSVLH